MTHSEIEKYTDEALLEGKSKQEIFNTLLAETDVKMQSLAWRERKSVTNVKLSK